MIDIGVCWWVSLQRASASHVHVILDASANMNLTTQPFLLTVGAHTHLFSHWHLLTDGTKMRNLQRIFTVRITRQFWNVHGLNQISSCPAAQETDELNWYRGCPSILCSKSVVKVQTFSVMLSAWDFLWRIEGSIDVSLMNYQGPSETLPVPLHRGFLHSSKIFCCHTPRRKRLWTFTCNVGRDVGKKHRRFSW